VTTRQVTMASGGGQANWNVTPQDGATMHGSTTLSDLGANASKVWTFGTSGGLNQPACQKMLGTSETRANGFDPATILNELWGAGGATVKIGSSTVISSYGPLGPIAPLGAIPDSLLMVADAAVILNTSRLTGDSWETAITLLHELGHLYNLLPGSGGSVIHQGLTDLIGGYDDVIVNNCLIATASKP